MATYELKFQLSDGSEVIAGTFTVPAGGGSAAKAIVINVESASSGELTDAQASLLSDVNTVIKAYTTMSGETYENAIILHCVEQGFDNDSSEYDGVYCAVYNNEIHTVTIVAPDPNAENPTTAYTWTYRKTALGGGGGSNVLNLDFANGRVNLTETEFAQYTNPSLVIYGYKQEPGTTDAEQVVIRMTGIESSEGDGTTTYRFYGGGVTLLAVTDTDWGGENYWREISGGYIPYGTTIHFTIGGTAYQATDAYTWQEWVDTEDGQEWFISTTEDGAEVVSGDEGTAYSWLTDSEGNSTAIKPSDSIIPNHDYYDYAP